MEQAELKKRFATLTLKEKVVQTILLNGNLFSKYSNTMNTGPVKNLGFKEAVDLDQIGAVYNVNDKEEIKRMQTDFLARSNHKIPLLFMSDVIYGYRTIFPMRLAQACSFDFDLIEQAAAMSAKEAYNNGLHVLYSPMLDLTRDPRWGRTMETPGEDVYTATRFAESVVKGYQGDIGADGSVPPQHVASCIKHFAGYGAPEAGRDYNTVDMSELRFRQTYLPPYQAALQAHTKLVMTAFNTLNGEPCASNKWLNKTILRSENHFNGLLVGDYAAVEELIMHGVAANKKEAAKKAIEASIDFDMMTSCYANHLEELIESGEIPRELLDDAVWRILVLKNELGLFENPYRGLDTPEAGQFLTENAKQIATELVEKSCVLLKNDKKALPLATNQKIALIGPYGKSKFTLGFWASVSGNPLDTVSLMDGMKQLFTEKNVQAATGYNLFSSYEMFGSFKDQVEQLNGPLRDENELMEEAAKIASDSDVIVITFGEQFLESGEGASKTSLDIDTNQKELLIKLHKLGKPIIGILYTGRPLVLTDVIPYFDALLLAWFPGTMGGVGISRLLSGEVSPSGKLSMTFPRHVGQIPLYYASYSTGRPKDKSNHSTRFVSKYIDEDNTPLFAFGHGLSYADLSVDSQQNKQISYPLKQDLKIELAVIVRNHSNMSVDEVFQLYRHNQTTQVIHPVKELVATKRVKLAPNAKTKIHFFIEIADFSYINASGEKRIDLGQYEWFIARASDSKPLQTTVVTLIKES